MDADVENEETGSAQNPSIISVININTSSPQDPSDEEAVYAAYLIWLAKRIDQTFRQGGARQFIFV